MGASSTLFFLLYLMCLALSSTTAVENKKHRSLQQSAIELSPFSVHLTSTYKSQDGEFLSELRMQTIRHLENIFWVWFNTETSNSNVYDFKDVGLAIDFFQLKENREDFTKYSASVSLSGLVYFDSDEAPSQEIVNDLQLDAFQGNMLQSFTEELQLSSDQFLKEIEGLDVKFATVESELEVAESSTDKLLLSVIIGAALGFVSFLMIMLFYAYTCRRKKTVRGDVLKQNDTEEYSTDDISGIEEASKHSLSLPSAASVSSSKFTYNPQSVRGVRNPEGTDSGSKSVLSKESTGTKSTINLNVNVDAWKAANPNTPPPVVPELEPDVSIISHSSTLKTIETFAINPSSPYSKKKKSRRKLADEESSLSKETLSASDGKRDVLSLQEDEYETIDLDRSFPSIKREGGVFEDLERLSDLIKSSRYT